MKWNLGGSGATAPTRPCPSVRKAPLRVGIALAKDEGALLCCRRRCRAATEQERGDAAVGIYAGATTAASDVSCCALKVDAALEQGVTCQAALVAAKLCLRSRQN
eukprot:6197015-Pleurochrysis_carterae.AAC.4